MNNFKYFQFKLFFYVFSEEDCKFNSIKFNIKTSQENIHKILTKGLNSEEVKHQTEIFGKCDLDIKIESVLSLLVKEVTDPFYIFQLFSIVLWLSNEYTQYAIVIIITTITSLIISVYETRVNLVNVQKMAKYTCKINVYRKLEVYSVYHRKIYLYY